MCVSPKKHKHFCKISQKFNENVLKPPKKCIFLFVLCAFFGKSRPFSVLSPVNPLLRTCFLILNHFRIPVKTAFLPPLRQNSQKHRFPKAPKTKREGQAPPLQILSCMRQACSGVCRLVFRGAVPGTFRASSRSAA